MRQKHVLALLVLLAAAAGPLGAQPTFLSEIPEANFFPAGDELNRIVQGVTEADVVETAYAEIQERLTASGYEVQIDLSDFQTYYAEDFDDVLISTLWDFPGGEYVQVDRLIMSMPGAGIGDHIHFDARWQTRDAMDADFAAETATKTLAEMIDAVKAEPSKAAKLPQIDAVTSYAVRLFFEGRERQYRAALTWEIFEDRPAEFRFMDVVLPQAEDILAAGEEVTPHRDTRDLWLEKDPASFFGGGNNAYGDPGDTICVHEYWVKNRRFIRLRDRTDHVSGEHYARIEASANCSCTSRCLAGCTPQWKRDPDCEDTGRLDRRGIRHEKGSVQRVIGAVDLGLAECRLGLGCAFKSCVNPFPCGGIEFTITVPRSGGELVIAPQGAVLSDLSITDSVGCLCHEDDDHHEDDCDRQGDPFPL